MSKRSERMAHRRWPTASGPSWICCQLGAREHYAVPAYFHLRGRLAALLTDAWIRPGTLTEKLAVSVFRPIRDRFDRQLADAPVYHFTSSLGRFEAGARLRGGISHWERIQSRNAWFQEQAVVQLNKLGLLETQNDVGPPTVFAYSYAARRIFEAARAAGCRTVLGQIDPGPYEEELVGGLYSKYRALEPDWHPAPSSYWHEWRQELALADRVVVNSRWSREALMASGISADKITHRSSCFRATCPDPDGEKGLSGDVYGRPATQRAVPRLFNLAQRHRRNARGGGPFGQRARGPVVHRHTRHSSTCSGGRQSKDTLARIGITSERSTFTIRPPMSSFFPPIPTGLG